LKKYWKRKIDCSCWRDTRTSSQYYTYFGGQYLSGLGIDVDLGLSTTPTVEVAVPLRKADGIILTASHNQNNGMP
jgi:phosphomannomutase